MKPEEFRAEMIQILKDDDAERAHINADRLMCDVLRELGYGGGANIFQAANLWYA